VAKAWIQEHGKVQNGIDDNIYMHSYWGGWASNKCGYVLSSSQEINEENIE